jgi:hypothetical protein
MFEFEYLMGRSYVTRRENSSLTVLQIQQKPWQTDLRTRMSKLNSETWARQLKNSARVWRIISRKRRKNNFGGSDWI